MKLLILGGTGFLGPHIVRRALDRGHQMTLFNRGRTNVDLFPELEKLRGDRNGELDALEGRSWDAVIDTSGYVPRHVRLSAELLADSAKQYLFVSSVSVYASFASPGIDESHPVGTLEDETVEQVTGATFGPLKALCEQAAKHAMPGRVANVRPGLIVGPGDNTDRFTYWPVRIGRGGRVLAPGDGNDPVQFIDARDLANWIIHCLESTIVGTYNAVSPPGVHMLKPFLELCREVTGSNAELVWLPLEVIREHELRPWADLPAWVPPEGDFAGFGLVSSAQAVAKGLRFRPLRSTIRDTLDWFKGLPEERQARLRAGLDPDRELAVLEAWAGRVATQ